MLRTGQSPAPSQGGLPPLRPRALTRRRECCYRGPWRLPGPDSHRLAAVSLSLGYVAVLLLSVVLGARATGRTFRRNHALGGGGALVSRAARTRFMKQGIRLLLPFPDGIRGGAPREGAALGEIIPCADAAVGSVIPSGQASRPMSQPASRAPAW